MPATLYLSTTILRTDSDGDTTEHDIAIAFDVTHYSPGCRACYYQRNGDPGWPAESAEYEFAIGEIEFDGFPPDEMLTPDELATLRTWFDANSDAAAQVANEQYEHNDGPDPDDARDREYDDRRQGISA